MTNTIAAVLFAVIVAALALDALLLDWQASIFLARRFSDLLEAMAFWR